GGESEFMYEYGTVEESGENNQASRASWSTMLTEPKLKDGTDITTFNFTKGNDGWDPLPDLIAADPSTGVAQPRLQSAVHVYAAGRKIYVSNVKSNTIVNVYSINGTLVKTFATKVDTDFNFDQGLWIVRVLAADGQKAVKVITR
ncbi:MAG TPA: T9SS type A sorting domain-containing protein, partial [Sunxiuqinia sp.]|nr:T9SS type A sorting domain-containing protein [Sunxiuqinia sp.]